MIKAKEEMQEKYGLWDYYYKKWLLKPEFEAVSVEILAAGFYQVQADNKFGLFSRQNQQWLLKPEFEAISVGKFADGFYWVKAGNKLGLADGSVWILKPEFESVEYVGDGKYVTIKDGQTNIAVSSMKKNRCFIKSKSLRGHHTRLKDGNYLVKINDRQGLWKLEKKRRWILPPKYREIIFIQPNVYLVSDSRGACLFKNGEWIKDRTYTGKEIVFVEYA